MVKKPKLQVRPPRNADEFVTGVAATPTPEPIVPVEPARRGPEQRAAPPQAPPQALRGTVLRAHGVTRARITVYLDPATAITLRRHCFEHGLQVSDYAAAAITEHVSKLVSGR